ncbi:MAG TPA: tyrosine-type recombinase/integrase [Nitrososphaeraceae archaeon]
MRKSTAREYWKRMTNFQEFIVNEYPTLSIDNIVIKIREGILDVYDVLNGYSAYLQQNHVITSLTLNQRIATVKNFLEYHDVDISPRIFKVKVKLPHGARKNKESLSKEDISDFLNECSDIRVKTYVLLLAATGMRATEGLSICIKDVDLKSRPVKLLVRGDYTKSRTY